MIEWYALLVFATLLVSGLVATGATTRLDNAIYDVALRLRRQPAPPANIVIVAIDNTSINAKGNWPWTRSMVASMIRHIARDHPRAIACDILFQTRGAPAEDKKLRHAMTLSPVFLPERIDSPGGGRAGSILRPIPEIASAAAGLGRASDRPDMDGIVRRTFLIVRFGGEAIPSLMTLMAGQKPPPPPGSANGRGRGSVDAIAKTLDRGDEVMIPFNGPPGRYNAVSASDVVDGTTPGGFFKDKYVLVGATAPGLLDNYPTPVSGAEGMPNIEIQATLLDALLHHRPIWNMPFLGLLSLSLGVVWALFFGFLQLEPGHLAIQGLLGSLIYLVSAIASLVFLGLWFPPTPVLITRTLMEVIWSSRRLQAASDYLARELVELQTRAGVAPTPRPNGPRLPMGDSVSRQMILIDETRRRVRELRRLVTDVLAGFPDPVFVVNPDGLILMRNKAAVTLGQRLAKPTDPGAEVQPILRDLEDAAGNKDKLWPPPEGPADAAPRGVGPGGRILEARYTPTGAGADQVGGWTLHLVDVTALVSAMRQREGALQLFTHDMRSPQSAILAALDHKDFQSASPALRASIEKNALRTLSLADGFVRLAQAEGAEYVFEPIDLFHLLGDAADALWPIAQSARVEIVVRDPGREFVVNADRGLLARAFINLLDNAIKFSPPGQQIVCSLREAVLHDRPAVACTLIDHGPGMTEEQQKTLFTRFARPPTTKVDTERRSRRPAGVGLGLAVVHTVVTRHDGSVECRSQLGQGTAFNIVLPLCAPERLGEEVDDNVDDE